MRLMQHTKGEGELRNRGLVNKLAVYQSLAWLTSGWTELTSVRGSVTKLDHHVAPVRH